MKSIHMGIVFLAGVSLASGQVTYEQLLNADSEPEHWLTYSGAYHSQRHSKLDQISRDNVKNLKLEWVFQCE
ncbi:MAG: hypothetical protein GY953_26650 [bacterium]|nr:hypothetical protein [bacterium]